MPSPWPVALESRELFAREIHHHLERKHFSRKEMTGRVPVRRSPLAAPPFFCFHAATRSGQH